MGGKSSKAEEEEDYDEEEYDEDEDEEESSDRQGAAPQKPSSKTAQTVEMTFTPGDLGLLADWSSGYVAGVDKGSKADKNGVKAGMWFEAVDGESYTEELLDEKLAGDSDFKVKFLFVAAQTSAPVADTSNFRAKNWKELAAEAAAKKKKTSGTPAAKKLSQASTAAAELTRLTAASKVAAQAAKRTAKAQPKAASDVTVKDDLSQGHAGAVWLALEDSMIREDRDVKSAKKGVVQEGERCTQTGPWRADPTGRVRMPVKAANGCRGWVTLDARRCRTVDGTWGSQYFELDTNAPEPKAEEEVDEEEEEVEEDDSKATAAASKQALAKPKKPAPKSNARAANEFDELLDMFGGDDGNSDDDEAAEEEEELQEETAEHVSADPVTVAEEIDDFTEQQEETVAATSKKKAPPPPSDLTDAQKRLRNAKKKLKEIEALEAKSDSLTEAQRERIARKDEVKKECKAAEIEVKVEQGLPVPKKRARKSKKAASDAVVSSGSSWRLWLLLFVFLPVLALVVSRFVLRII